MVSRNPRIARTWLTKGDPDFTQRTQSTAKNAKKTDRFFFAFFAVLSVFA